MTEISIICPRCKDLVPVIDRTISEHGDCEAGGMRYIPSPRSFSSGPGSPSFKVLATKETKLSCPSCGGEHGGLEALVEMRVPDPRRN